MNSGHNIINDILSYECIHDCERVNKLLILAFIQNNAYCFERSSEDGHVTGSALLVSHDMKYVLLHFHNLIGRWINFGGHADGSADILGVAKRELIEESGIADVELLSKNPSSLDIHYIPHNDLKNENEHLHYDIMYTFICKKPEIVLESPEGLAMSWIPIDLLRHYPSDHKLVRALKRVGCFTI